jgi:hypothetical protein
MKRPTRKRAPEANPTPKLAISRIDSSGDGIAQVAKLLETFAKTEIPDLWHYGVGLQNRNAGRMPYSPQFGEEVLDFWALAHDLQNALRGQPERGRP